ncbi:hypothetical protein DCAR_0522393 [Daucus carota subsp. sativus]|uniref:Uncharacterized protein n=1 Tax=Daucus carota subsp. sativus TaxID=79200 RepID=A0A164ZSC1_DAUCS|nr:PREDICTED: uncharacterized protein LOC108220853 [Daucus carota subsp. sativus]WOH03003.1 hypothetical protein DCAR_0522393 [Daucus carota subsp. sativus]
MEPSSSSDRATTHHRSHDLFICFTSTKTSTSSKSPTRQGSAMFNTASRKRGSGAESNPEPTSPKVTCIGQVRVKTKKQGDKMRNLSRRSAEMSFRKVMQRQSSFNSIHHQQECSSHRNQRWVHLPLTLCETLRSEFSCLFPCKSSCLSQSTTHCRDDLEEWMNDEEDYEDEKVVRRHVFDEIEIKDCFEQGGRVSLCVPPKNALLLMRCRSDPVKMEALAKKVYEPKLHHHEHDHDDEDCNDENDDEEEDCNDENDDGNVDVDHAVSFDKVKVVEVFEERRASISYNIVNQENLSDVKVNDLLISEGDDEICEPSYREEAQELKCAQDGAIEGEGDGQVLERDDLEIKNVEREGTQRLPECLLLMMCEPKLSMEVSKETWVCSTDFVRNRGQKKKLHAPNAPPCAKTGDGDGDAVVERRKSVDSRCGDNPFAALPPLYPAARDVQPGRASCCLPAARGGVSMASMIEQKLGDAVAYEPFVLTRCKSEPMRTASKLAQEGCFWKNKALGPHGRAPFGVGAAEAGC